MRSDRAGGRRLMPGVDRADPALMHRVEQRVVKADAASGAGVEGLVPHWAQRGRPSEPWLTRAARVLGRRSEAFRAGRRRSCDITH